MRKKEINKKPLIKRSAGFLFFAFIFSAMLLPVVVSKPVSAADDCSYDKGAYNEWGLFIYDKCAPVDVCVDPSASPDIVGGEIPKDWKDFIDKYGQFAYNVGKKNNIPYEAILGQAALESGWGKSSLTYKYNNFFGIKAGSAWKGATVTMRTAEYREGSNEKYYINDVFRVYPNPEAGFEGYAEFILKNSRYSKALQYPNDPINYIKEIAAAGYATDNNYANLVIGMMKQIQGYIKSSGKQYASASTTETTTGQNSSAGSTVAAGIIPAEGMWVSASHFGGRVSGGKLVYNPSDNQGGDAGKYTPHLTGKSAFAELGNEKALGGLKPNTKLKIYYKDKTVIAEKLDFGGHTGSDTYSSKEAFSGYTGVTVTPPANGSLIRGVDLWWETANQLGVTGTVPVFIQVVSDSALPGSDNCTSSQSSTQVSVNTSGYAFPVALPKADIGNFSKMPCPSKTCHHDGSGAVDLAKKTYKDSSVGVPVVAITSGVLQRVRQSYSGQQGCNSFQLVGDDGWMYWYGHIQKVPPEGTKVKAGQQVGVIGERRCTGNGSDPHLHIDRGYPKGRSGGSVNARDPDFPQLINKLYGEIGR